MIRRVNEKGVAVGDVAGGIQEGTGSLPQDKEQESEAKGDTNLNASGNADVASSEGGVDILEANKEALNEQLNISKMEAKIKELEERELIRLGNDYKAFLLWCRRREKLTPDDDLFFIYEEAWNKANALIRPLCNYILGSLYKDVLFSVGLHYIIVEPFTYENEAGELIENPLYKKYKIESKAYLISSASDEGSSSSVHITNSLQNGDFLMQDLLRTRYGTWAYTILEQLDIGATLL